jgi:uncharacterized protein YigE (DUF2233 family)
MRVARRAAAPFAVAVAIVAAAWATSAAHADATLQPAEVTTFKAGPNLKARASILTVDPTKLSVRIVSVPLEMESEPGSGEHSLRRFAEHVDSRARSRRSWAVVNGGFSSSRDDIPLGLLVVDGKVYSRLTKVAGSASTGSVGSSYAKYKWSGVLCQGRKDGPWDIIAAAEYEAKRCHQALQAGPMLVEPDGRVAIASTEPERTRPYARTVVCLAGSKLKFVVVQDQVHLLPLAKWLTSGKDKGGPGCRVAMNLSGDSSSGMAQRQADREGIAYFGDGTFPIPSAVLIEERRR